MTGATIFGLPLLYLIGPLVVFGPILFFVAYSLGLGGLFRKSEGPMIAGDGAERRAHDAHVRTVRDGAWFLGKRLRQRPGVLAYGGQALLFLPFLAFIGFFASNPSHRVIGADQALVKLSLAHAGRHVEECRRLTREELAALPPNMRTPMKCKRARWPVTAILWLNNTKIYEVTAQPSGLSDDGPSVIYQTFPVPVGRHVLRVTLLDSGAPDVRAYERTINVKLVKGQALAIEFDEKSKRITYR